MVQHPAVPDTTGVCVLLREATVLEAANCNPYCLAAIEFVVDVQ